MSVANAIMEFGGKEFTCKAYPALGVGRPLLGREVLKRAGLLYNPPSELKLLIR